MNGKTPVSGKRVTETPEKRWYTFRLSFSGAMTALIVGLLSLGCAFVMGVIVGRGYNPEHQIPQLARWLPSEADDKQSGQETVESLLPPAKVIEPEELRFAGALKNGGTSAAPAAPAPSPAAAGTPPATPAAPQLPETPPPPAAPLFSYSFQLATYKGPDAARALLARLEGQGYRARLSKGGKLYKVILTFRGTEQKAGEVRQALRQLGLSDILQLSKTPVEQARPGGAEKGRSRR